MGQQFYVIRNNPAPNTPAFEAKVARDHAKAVRKGLVVDETAATPETAPVEETPSMPGRQQPKKQPRSKRKKQSGPDGSAEQGDES
jgi:YidC/Oxa1 family membrane protein insertase